MKIETLRFKGDVQVTVSDNEVRLWVCNGDGQCVFRLKALGEVHKGINDVIVTQK